MIWYQGSSRAAVEIVTGGVINIKTAKSLGLSAAHAARPS